MEIDLARLSANGYVTPAAARSRLAEEFRVIKRPLLTNARGKSAAPIANANRIMVTSALPGEGKTYVSLNLAMSIAMELDTSVLLVDADASRPAVLDRLGLPPSRGLLDLLVDPALSLDECVLATNVERLSILPAGTQQSQATELLASESMTPPRRTAVGRRSAPHRAVRHAAAAGRVRIARARSAHGTGDPDRRGRRHAAGFGHGGARDYRELPGRRHAAQQGLGRQQRQLLRLVRRVRRVGPEATRRCA